jgi:hypothetical protein
MGQRVSVDSPRPSPPGFQNGNQVLLKKTYFEKVAKFVSKIENTVGNQTPEYRKHLNTEQINLVFEWQQPFEYRIGFQMVVRSKIRPS